MPFMGSDQIAAIIAKQILQKYWIWHFNDPHEDISGTWVVAAYPSQHTGAVLHTGTYAINDEFSIPLLVFTTEPITLNIRSATWNNRGISSIYVDGVFQGNLDWYAASGQYNVIKTLTITPARIGANALRLKMASKNGSSTDYAMMISEMWLS